MKPVHTRLLGDVDAATRRLPFAQSRLGIMLREHARGPATRAIVRHFEIEGDAIDLWVDSQGGRITIKAGTLGDLREYGMAYGEWRLFSQDSLLEVATSRVPLGSLTFPTTYFPSDATTLGFLGATNVAYVHHDKAGAEVWAFTDFIPLPAVLPGNPPFVGAQGFAFAGDVAVLADGTESRSQVIYEDYPFNLNVLGYQLDAATLRYAAIDLATGAVLAEGPTKTAVVWGAAEAVFKPVKIAGAYPAAPTFHAIGFVYGQGTDEDTNRLVVVGHELHHVDSSDLSTLDTIALPEQPLDLVVDKEGTVYVRFAGNPGRFEAYTRQLARLPEKDFNNIAAEHLSPGRDTTAIAGGYLFSKVEVAPDFWRLKKLDRSGAVVANVPIPFSLTITDQSRLVLIRN